MVDPQSTLSSPASRRLADAGDGQTWMEPYLPDWSLSHQSVNVGQLERVASIASGAVLVGVGLARGRGLGLAAVCAGAALVYRGVTGHCHGYGALGIDTAEHSPMVSVPAQAGVKIEHSVRVERSPEELFAFWREFANLPQVMQHLKSVTELDSRRSRWVAEGPLGSRVEWEAEVYNERPDELIAWRSLPGSMVDNAGSVHFVPMADGRATELRVSLKYNPPGGKLGVAIANLLGSGAKQQIEDDLRNLKQSLETALRQLS